MLALAPRSLKQALAFITAGCLMGSVTVVVLLFGPAVPAFAACSADHTNVEGYDSDSDRYGNYGEVYINTSGTIGSTNAPIFRSLFVTNGTFANDVEVGWTDHNGGHDVPTVYSEWVNRGVDSGPQFYTSYSLSYDSYTAFTDYNSGHQEIFRFKVDGQSSPFNYSPTMNFDQGLVITNSEHHNSCDSLWTDMYSLAYYNSSGSYHTSYGNLACYSNNSINSYLFNKISNSELKVDKDVGVTC